MVTEPWWAYPPEVNAARLIGAGPATWISATSTWAALSVQVQVAQAVFAAQNALQFVSSMGATSLGVAATIQPFSAWLQAMQAEAARASIESQNIASAYVSTVASTVPMPVAQANRAAATAAYTSNAFGVPNPAGPILDAQYAGMQMQNASAMSAYDATAQASTAPRTFVPAPRLVTGDDGLASTVAESNEAVSATGENMLNEMSAHAGDMHSAAAGAMSDPAAAPYMAQAGAVGPQAMMGARQAFMPAQGLMGQMASPINGVMGNGLGTGAQGMGASSPMSRGGLPLSPSVGGVSSAPASMGGSSAGLGAAAAAKPLGGFPGSGVGAGAGAGSPARMGPSFRGVPMESAPARGPVGGMPMGAGAGNRSSGESRSDSMVVNEVAYTDPKKEAALEEKRAKLFR